jgi:hypothetical protein
VLECQFVPLKEGLLGAAPVGPMECTAAGHASHREDLQLLPLPSYLRHGLVPVNLCLHPVDIVLRYECLAVQQPQDSPALPDVPPHR